MKPLVLCAFVAVILVGLPRASDAQKQAKTPSADQKFLEDAAEGGKAEVELGKLAAERGGSDAVKKFGQRMVTDHGKANDELQQLAQQKSVRLPTDLSAAHKRLHDRLSKLSGAQFDAAYAREMVRDHDKDIKDFQRESKRGKDADVKAWAGKTLATLEDHQEQARQMSAAVTDDSSPSASSHSR
jgi:putative membrane protein